MIDMDDVPRPVRALLTRVTFEALVAVLMMAGLVGLTVAVSEAANNEEANQDLVLANLGREMRTLLSVRTDTILLPVAVSYGAGPGALRVDTITVTPSGRGLPSLSRGGFLNDQLVSINYGHRRGAWHSRVTGGTQVSTVPGLLAVGPIQDSLGRRGVVLDPSALTTLSPFAERAWRTVLAYDSRRFFGLIHANGVVLPDSLATIARPDVRSRDRCAAVLRKDLDAADVYCGALTGAERQLNEEYRLGGVSRMARGQQGRLSLGRTRRLWLNGVRGRDTVLLARAGDVLFAPSTRAMIPSEAVSGALAGTSLINGSRRFFVKEGTLRALAISLARTNATEGEADTTVLALHSALTGSLDSAAADFIRAKRDIEAIELIVLDAGTGGVRAMVGRTVTGPSAFLPGFEPSFIGSLVKPIVAAAILSEQPDLAALQVTVATGEKVREVRGVRVAPFDAGPATGRVDLREFIRMSSNKFAAELVFESLARSNGGQLQFDQDGDVPLGLLERSDLALGLLTAFDVQPGGDKSQERDERVWWTDPNAASPIAAMAGQPWNWPWAPRPSLFVVRRRGTRADSLRGASATILSRFAYGQGFNEWTLLGASQALARVVTGRSVTATLLARSGGPQSAFPWSTANWAAELRAGLNGVVTTGTARGLEDAFRTSFGKRAVDVYGKTGTAHLDDVDRRADRNALGLFIAPHNAGPTAPRCGLSIVLAVDYVGGRPAGGARHLEFARSVVAPLLARHWDGSVTCPVP